ncbi:CRTAC1 family protein [Shimia abyssi]|uniref:VCBS repeat protein n=1 Tax=Shimia abyssi TaxID=1662395 RepID=A0A2P8F8Z1_9RHOB|nr:CRTAC1 family protein [Shimia abyssi]PSL18184.1 VCBS repeat protein [Shimia abyssi]
MLERALILGGFVVGSVAAADPKFTLVDVPQHRYEGGWEHFVGGGVAVFDCDGDHLPDVFAAGGSNSAVLMRNRGNMVFEAETPDALMLSGVVGAYPLDVDSDGHLDLAVLRVGENLLLQGDGACGFQPFEMAGFDGRDRWTTAFSATWEADHELPTLAFGNYVDRDDPKGPFEACDTSEIFRPGADGYEMTVLEPGYCPLSMLFSDWGRLGRADLRVSNDRHYYVRGGQEQLWAMEAVPRLYGAKDGWRDHQLWGMGIAARDLDGDGMSEVYLTSMGDQRLQRLSGTGPSFEDVPYEMGTTAHRPYQGGDGRPSTGWHVSFGDVQNDGLDDIFVTKGNVEQMPGSAMEDPNNLLIQGPDGRFEEFGGVAGLADMARSRGAAMSDLDLDGRLDLVVVNRRAPLRVYRNETEETGNWISVLIGQSGANRNAIGAWLEVDKGDRVLAREITVGGGHAGGVFGPEHFGLGAVEAVRVRVIWPDGLETDWMDVPVNTASSIWRNGDAIIRSSD